MQNLLHGFDWSFIQSHLPLITLILVGVPLSLLLYKDFVRLSAKSNDKKKVREVRVLSRMRDENGNPVFMKVFGEPSKAHAPITSVGDFETRRVVAIRSGKSRY